MGRVRRYPDALKIVLAELQAFRLRNRAALFGEVFQDGWQVYILWHCAHRARV